MLERTHNVAKPRKEPETVWETDIRKFLEEIEIEIETEKKVT